MTLEQVLEALRSIRCRCQGELALQAHARDVLMELHPPPGSLVREMSLADGSRLDFGVRIQASLWAIEVKVGGSVLALERQLIRYAMQPEVGGLIAVTTRLLHARLPDQIDGKPVHTVLLPGAFL